MNVFEELRKDHEKQRTLVDLLIKTKGNSEGRSELLERLKGEIDAHAAAEERAFYKPLLDSDLAQEKARHSIAEHKEIDDLIEELEDTDFSSPGWLSTAKHLRERLIHHLDEEEHEVFQIAGKALDATQKNRLSDKYRSHYQEAR